MTRNIYLSMFMLVFLSMSCSKSDNDTIGDPVFDAEYTPLKNIKEIDSKAWAYAGSKVGDRKFGRISDSSCMTKNLLVFNQVNPDDSNGIFDYFNYSLLGKGCKIEFVSRLMIHRVTNEESWCTYRKLDEIPADGDDISNGMPIEANPFDDEDSDGSEESKKSNSLNNNSKKLSAGTDSQPSKVEIGFQAGYLRIEDKLSNFSGKEKVYLYFKKQ